MGQSYTAPSLPPGTEVVMLRKEDDKANELTPDTFVTCINRGRRPLVDMFDAQNYVIPPGYFQLQFGAAQHFQKRQVVPGTKNLAVGGFKSWIGILGVDSPELCEPFTDDELEHYGEAVEAIDRSAEPDGASVRIIRTSSARAGVSGQGLISTGMQSRVGGVPRPQQSIEADTEAGKGNAEHAMDRVEGSDAANDQAEAAASGWQPPTDDGTSQSVQRPKGAALARGRARSGE